MKNELNADTARYYDEDPLATFEQIRKWLPNDPPKEIQNIFASMMRSFPSFRRR